MKFNFRLFIRSMLLDVLFFIISIIISTVIGRTILLTIAYAIFGEENGVAAATVMMRVALILIVFAMIEIISLRNDSEKKDYLSYLQDKPYIFTDDCKNIIKTEKYFNECIAITILIALCSIIMSAFYLLALIIVFYFLHIWFYTTLHRRWAKSRIRYKG